MDFPLSIWYERNHVRELPCAQYKLLIVLEVSQAAKAITTLTTIGFSLTNSIILSTILQEIKRKQQQAFKKNSMYVFVYCLKLTNRPEITTKAHGFVLINRGKKCWQLFANSRLFAKCCRAINRIVNFTIQPGLVFTYPFHHAKLQILYINFPFYL